MAFELSRVDRLTRTIDLAAKFPGRSPITAAQVALLAPRSTPNASTVWYTATVASDTATVLFAGPDADPTGAVVVSGSADLWVKITATSEVDAAKVERITVLGGGSVPIIPLDRGLPAGGTTGQVLTKASGNAYDAEWDNPTGGTGGGSTTDASLLTSGILPAARIADSSIADAKLSSGTALTSAERTKLTGIATAATANSPDATLLARANHTGTQAATTITGLATVATTGAYADLSGKPTIPAATTDASALTSGTLPAARIADGSLPIAKLAVDIATQAELDALAPLLNQDAATKSDVRNIIAKGDSLTSGNQDGTGYTYPSFLATALGTGVSITNAGQPGWTSTEVAVRDGGLPVALDAFTLPAGTGTTAVTVTSPTGFWNAAPAIWSGVLNVSGTLYPGQMIHQATGTATFARTTAGSSVSVPAGSTFTCTEQTAARGNLTLIEAGRNNSTDTSAPTRVPADVAAMVANLSPTVKRYLVLSVHTGSNELSGSTVHTRIKAVNDALAAAHGARYVDTRRYLIDNGLALNGLTPTAADLTAIAADTVPPQLVQSADNLHPNQYGYKAMAQAVLNQIVALGWAPDKLTPLPILPVTLPTPAVTFDPASLTTGATVTALPVTQGAGTSDQPTVSKRPTVVAAGGRQWVSFDGVDDSFNVSAPLITQPVTVVMRVKARNLSTVRGLIWPNGSGPFAGIQADGSIIMNAGSNLSTPAGQVVANTEVVIGIVYAGASSLIQVGTNPVVTGNPGTFSNTPGGWWIIGYYFNGADQAAAIDVNKIKVYSAALNATQLAQAISTL